MRKFNLVIVLKLIGLAVFAQSGIRDSVRLDEVVVTGSKSEISRKIVPLSVSQISKQEIERTGQINILPALNTFTPGVFVTERNVLGFGVATGGSGSISMRGVSSSPNTSVLVLIDGHPQYQGIFGHPLPDAYVASDVEKVEIIRGPASLLYGSNAMGGVINIITRKNSKEGFSGSVGASYGSYNTQKYYGTLGFKKDKFSVFASANHDQTDGIRTNTDFKVTNGFTKVGYEFNENWNFSADFNIAKYNANDNGPVWKTPTPVIAPNTVAAAPVLFGIDILRGKTSVSIENKFARMDGAFKMYHNFGEHILPDNKLPNNTLSPFRSTDRSSGIMLFETFKLLKNNSVTVGGDFKQYGGMINQLPIKDTLVTINELSAYAYMQQTLFTKFTLSAGLRFENNSKFGNELIPMAGLTYNLNQNTSFKTSVSKGFRSPTIMELYMNAPVPNPNLEPERMMNYEISWLQSLLNNKLRFELTAYKVIGQNMIQVTGIFPNLKKENVGSFSNQGVEFSAKYAVNKNLHLHANYSYLDLSKAVVAAPRQQLNISGNYGYKIWNLNVSTQYIEKLYTFISPNPAIAKSIQPDYLLLNARIACSPIKNLELFVSGNNLLDQKYQINYGYPLPGINFNGGVSYKF
jgi:iron complex outermembrane receptor protein